MAESKPLASLTSSLLARKGGARPAMRRQLVMDETPQDDLGWNDMGDGDAYQSDPMAVAGLTPMPQATAATPVYDTPVEPIDARTPVPTAMPVPAVVEQRRALAEQVETPVQVILPKAALRKAKAAFTLRLDPDRHLRLRLACAVGNRSAQQIVTQALDAFLNNRPDIDALADSVAKQGTETHSVGTDV